MNLQISSKINNFIKKRLIEFIGILLMALSIFFLASIFTYSPNDPNFIYSPVDTKIENLGGYYGSVISDFFLQAIGLIFVLFALSILGWGFTLTSDKKINNIISKLFYVIVYIFFD